MKSLAVINALLALLLSGCARPEDYPVQRIDLVQAVYASGEVLPVAFYQATSKMPGIVDSIYVDVGQRVAAGDPLLKIQNQTNAYTLQTAKNLYELAKKQASENSDLLTGLEQQVQAAYQKYQQDSLDFERYKRLHAKQIGSEQAYEQARLRYQVARSDYVIAQSNLQETQQQLQIELKNARNNYLAQQSQLGDYLIVAARSGKVYDILPQIGELVTSSRPMIDLGAADSFEVEMLVDETDIILIEKGQHVIFELDALQDSVFRGTVQTIYPRINPVDKTAKVMASIDPAAYALYPGMSLEANIIIREKKDILAIPVEYLTAEQTVLVKKGSSVENVPVKTGVRDLRFVEILAGLEANDRILKP